MVHLRVGEHPRSSCAALFVAADAGFFAAENIKIDFRPLDEGSPAALAALVNGELDINTTGPRADFLNAVARGAKVRIVAGLGCAQAGVCTQVAWMVRSNWLDKDGHLDPRRLKGARARFEPLSYSTFQTSRALATVGLSIDDFRRVPIASTLAEQALERGDLDFAYLAAVPLARAMANPRLAVWKTLPDVIPRVQLFTFAFAPRLLGPDREIGIRFLMGYLRGLRALNRGFTPRFKDILAKRFDMTRQEIDAFCLPAFPNDARIELSNWLDYENWVVSQHALDRSLSPDEFADTTLLAEANRRLAAADQ